LPSPRFSRNHGASIGVNKHRMALQSSRTVTRSTAAVVVGFFCFFTDLLEAGADARLEAVDSRAQIREAGHTLDIEIAGNLAVMRSQQTLVNASKEVREALYTFRLPGDAAVTGLSVRLADGRTTRTVVVESEAALHFPSAAGISVSSKAAPDIGLLRLVERNGIDPTGGLATYEARIFPLQPGKAVTVRTTWVAPVRQVDGRISLRIPGRGASTNLVAERVRVTVAPPPGAHSITSVYGGGRKLAKTGRGKRSRYEFLAPSHGDLVVEAVPKFRRHSTPDQTRVQASFVAIPVTKSFGALAVNVSAPPIRGTGTLSFERAVLIVDISRSMGQTGVEAAAKLSTSLLASMPPGTKVEAVVFDRRARRALGSFQHNDHRTQRAIAAALAPTALENGSDLGQALIETRRLIENDKLGSTPAEGVVRGARSTNLIAILSDGMTPLELTLGRAAGSLGDDVLRDSEILAVALVPDGAPIPDITEGPMAELTSRARGRSIAVRHAEAESRGHNLAAELGRPAPLYRASLDAGDTVVTGDELFDRMEPGHGTFSLSWYHGPAPKKLTLTGTVRGKRVAVPVSRGSGAHNARLLALAVARSAPGDFLQIDADPDDPDVGSFGYDEASREEARRLFVATARRASTVSEGSALVALDSRDALAKDRLALVEKWGPGMYFRFPPPDERTTYHQFRPFEEKRDLPGPRTGASIAAIRRTGTLDEAIVKRLIETHVLPKAKACYNRALRQDNRLRGALTLVVEIARGEVQHVEITGSTFTGANIEACVAEAAYGIRVPRVALGDDPETVGVAHYPLRFNLKQKKGHVGPGKGVREKQIDVDLDKPLGGISK